MKKQTDETNSPTNIIRRATRAAFDSYSVGDTVDGWDIALKVQMLLKQNSKASLKFRELSKTSKNRTKGHIAVFYGLHEIVEEGRAKHVSGVNQGYIVTSLYK